MCAMVVFQGGRVAYSFQLVISHATSKKAFTQRLVIVRICLLAWNAGLLVLGYW